MLYELINEAYYLHENKKLNKSKIEKENESEKENEKEIKKEKENKDYESSFSGPLVTAGLIGGGFLLRKYLQNKAEEERWRQQQAAEMQFLHNYNERLNHHYKTTEDYTKEILQKIPIETKEEFMKKFVANHPEDQNLLNLIQ